MSTYTLINPSFVVFPNVSEDWHLLQLFRPKLLPQLFQMTVQNVSRTCHLQDCSLKYTNLFRIIDCMISSLSLRTWSCKRLLHSSSMACMELQTLCSFHIPRRVRFLRRKLKHDYILPYVYRSSLKKVQDSEDFEAKSNSNPVNQDIADICLDTGSPTSMSNQLLRRKILTFDQR